MKQVIKLVAKILPTHTAYAHCDVPCGIYDPQAAQTAAQTMLKMVKIIKEIPENSRSISDRNKFVRAVMTKEEHGRLCKHELSVLWADYFKEEHLAKFPDLHTMFWNAMKMVSKNKQSVDLAIAEDLVKAVDEIADVFNQTKASK